MSKQPDIIGLPQQLDLARQRLTEAEATLRAIRQGDVDAVVVDSGSGPQVYTLKSAAEPYRLIVEQMREGAVTIAEDGTILYCNAAFESLAGSHPGRLVGQSLAGMVDGEMLKSLIGVGGCAGRELGLTRADGRCLELLVSAAPLQIEDRVVHCIVATDVSRQGLRLRHEAIVAAANDAIYALSPDLVVETWNPGAMRLFGYQPDDMIGRPERELYPEDQRRIFDGLVGEVRRSGSAAKADICRQRKDGALVHAILCLAPLTGPTGELAGYAAVAHDITERKTAEETQRLLLGELNHRVKNTLATVQSIANQTLRRAETPAAFATAFSGRIQALARAHDVLTASTWQGADLATLVREQLLIGAAHESRCSCSGPQTTLEAQPALVLALMLHELGTNARKYGALSTPLGRVVVKWAQDRSVTPPLMRLSWQEVGGPPVNPPRRRGFGSLLIEQSIRTCGGAAEIRFEPHGVRCEVAVPLGMARA